MEIPISNHFLKETFEWEFQLFRMQPKRPLCLMNNINDLVEMLIYLEDMEILSVYSEAVRRGEQRNSWTYKAAKILQKPWSILSDQTS